MSTPEDAGLAMKAASRATQNEVISKFLAKHPIPYQDVKSFRKLLAAISFKCDLHHHDADQSVQNILELTFSEIPVSVLKQDGYDPTLFTEDELPRAMSKSGQKVAEQRRSMLFVLQDIDASKAESMEESYQYRDRKSQLNSLNTLIERHDLRIRRKGGTVEKYDPDRLWLSLWTLFYNHQLRQETKQPFEVIWKTGTDHIDPGWLAQPEEARKWLYHSRRSMEPGTLEQSPGEGVNAQNFRFVPPIGSQTQASETTQVSTESSAEPKLTTSPATDEHEDVTNLVANNESRRDRRQSATRTHTSHELSVIDGGSQVRNATQLDRGSPVDTSKKRKFSDFDSPAAIPRALSRPFTGHDPELAKQRDSIRHEVRTLFEHLHQRQQNAVAGVFRRIGLDQVYYSPCVKDPPACLAKLFAQCLGHDWMIAEGLLRRKGWLSAFDMATALLSAYLYNEVQSVPPPWLQDFERSASIFEHELRGYCNVSGIGLEDLKKTKIFNYVSSDTFRGQHLRKHAQNLVDDFCSCFEPYVAALSDQAVRMTRHLNQAEWQTYFRTELQSLFEDALVAHARMAASSSSFVFFWPVHGQAVDFKYFSAPYAKLHEKDSDLTVAFARRPGLLHRYSVGQEAREEISCIAEVVTQSKV